MTRTLRYYFCNSTLPATLSASAQPRLFSVGGTGGGQYRVLVTATQVRGVPETLVIAVPMTGVTSALHRLVVIEVIAALALLAALTSGSWLILRRGLHPLEEMASTARTITAGDLTQRVAAGSASTEVGELGLALNSMLDDIQAAFEERDATERRLRQFLSDASHELRTPLTSIQGFAELFRVSGDRARVDLPTILRRIEQESGRMRVLVEDLLLLARLDETRPADVAPVDLAVLAADACSDAIAAAPDRCVRLDAPTPVLVDGDEAHLRQAVGNLVTNAIKHTGAGGQIEVRASRHDGVARITVSDRGPGLTDAALQHVFDRFWQEDSARVGTGAGLGLAIVSSVAAEHGGRAAAANRDGGGAEFTVELPIRRSPAAGAGLVAA